MSKLTQYLTAEKRFEAGKDFDDCFNFLYNTVLSAETDRWITEVFPMIEYGCEKGVRIMLKGLSENAFGIQDIVSKYLTNSSFASAEDFEKCYASLYTLLKKEPYFTENYQGIIYSELGFINAIAKVLSIWYDYNDIPKNESIENPQEKPIETC